MELINVNEGELLLLDMRWFRIVESLLVYPCIIVMLSHICDVKAVCTFTLVKCKTVCILHMMFLLHH